MFTGTGMSLFTASRGPISANVSSLHLVQDGQTWVAHFYHSTGQEVAGTVFKGIGPPFTRFDLSGVNGIKLPMPRASACQEPSNI